MSQALAFSIQRAGLLYGTCDEEGAVCAHFIYEPPQQARVAGAACSICVLLLTWRGAQGSAEGVEFEENEAELRRVDFIAERLGCAFRPSLWRA